MMLLVRIFAVAAAGLIALLSLQGVEAQPGLQRAAKSTLRRMAERSGISADVVNRHLSDSITETIAKKHGLSAIEKASVAAPSDQLRKRLTDDVEVRLYLAAAGSGMIDPRIVRAVTGTDTSQVSRMAAAPTVDVKRVRALSPYGRPGKSLARGRDLIVFPGENNPGTPLALAPNLDPIRGAPLSPTIAPKPNGHLSEAVYPAGFVEVGILGLQDVATCTATAVASSWILTAAHCVKDQLVSELGFYRLVGGGTDKIFLRSSTGVASTPRTGLKRYAIAQGGIAIHPLSLAGQNDLAVLKLATPISEVGSAAVFREKVVARMEITFVGFGLSSNPDSTVGGNLSVGWHTANFDAVNQTLTWTYQIGQGSNACSGDSGGPVYAGTHHGYTGEVHQVVAIISRVSGCTSGSTLSVVSADSLNWMCQVTRNGLPACGSAQNTQAVPAPARTGLSSSARTIRS
jgi:hypothetical protein